MQFNKRSGILKGGAVLLALAALAGCDIASVGEEPSEPGVREATTQGPEGAMPGSCWGRTVSPAVIETVTEQVQVQPAQISTTEEIQALPIYRTETRQKIVTQRKDNWFETPCADQLTPQFIETLQRALAARGEYGGEISGLFDAPTRKAMRIYQTTSGGPDSPVLALETARALGLIAVERSTLE